MHAETTIEIRRPPAVVFRFVATDHLENHRRWDRTILDLEQTTPGPVAIGTQFTFGRRIMGRLLRQAMRVSELVPDRKLVLQLTGPMDMEMSMLIEPAGPNASRLTFQGAGHMAGPMRLFEPLIKRRLGREFQDSQRRIKEMVEAPGSPGNPAD